MMRQFDSSCFVLLKAEISGTPILSVQDEIAASITDALRIQLPGLSAPALFTHATEDPDAYVHYLKGRYYWHQRTPGVINKCEVL